MINSLRTLLGLPVIASEHGIKVDSFIVYVHLLMLVLFVGWFAYFVCALFLFNRKRNPKADYVGVKNHLSTYVELGVVLVETLLLFVLAIPLWAEAVDSDKFP